MNVDAVELEVNPAPATVIDFENVSVAVMSGIVCEFDSSLHTIACVPPSLPCSQTVVSAQLHHTYIPVLIDCFHV